MGKPYSNHYSLLSSADGYTKLLEYDGSDGIVYIWSIAKKFNICKACKSYQDFVKCDKFINCSLIVKYVKDAGDIEYIEYGDFDDTEGYYNSIEEYISLRLKDIYPDIKVIPLGFFENINECRLFLRNIKTILIRESMYDKEA